VMTDPESEPDYCQFETPAGVLGGLCWGRTDNPPIIALHGWLDNAASFSRLGPRLALDHRVIALDLPGHGQSFHRPPGESYEMLDYVRDLAQFLECHAPEGAILLGHSLGGIIGLLLAVAAPDRVRGLIMIDSLGPLVGDAESFPGDLRKSIDRMRGGSRGSLPVYADPEEAVTARMGGRIPLSRDAAEVIVPRNLIKSDNGWSWVTDPRLRYPSMHRLDEAEVTACLRAVAVPVLVVRASHGLLTYKREMMEERYGYLPDYRILDTQGGHHCHVDGRVEEISAGCREWLEQRMSKE